MNLEELERLAKEATPGPWFNSDWNQDGGPNETTVETRSKTGSTLWPDGIGLSQIAETAESEKPIENARYIAAANPKVILEMITKIRALETEVHNLECEKYGFIPDGL